MMGIKSTCLSEKWWYDELKFKWWIVEFRRFKPSAVPDHSGSLSITAKINCLIRLNGKCCYVTTLESKMGSFVRLKVSTSTIRWYLFLHEQSARWPWLWLAVTLYHRQKLFSAVWNDEIVWSNGVTSFFLENLGFLLSIVIVAYRV